jgi:hypothetical protein
MATRITRKGIAFEFDYDALAWRAVVEDRQSRLMAEALTDLLDAGGPSGGEPNIGEWAIDQVRAVISDIKVVSVEDPAGSPFEVY